MLGAGSHARPQVVHHGLTLSESRLDFDAVLCVQCTHPAPHICRQRAIDGHLHQGRGIASEATLDAILVAKLSRTPLLDVHRGDVAVKLEHGLEEVLWEVHRFDGNESLQVLEHLKGK